MKFPILAFTLNGLMPYTKPKNLLRCMAHEYDLGWYNELELIDSAGTCVVIESARVVKQPVLARMFGRMVEVEIQSTTKLADYDVAQMKDRTMEFLCIYADMYQSAVVYDEIVKQVESASTTAEIVQAFTP